MPRSKPTHARRSIAPNRAKRPRRVRPYHHGDLRAGLLEAVAGILRDEGIAGVSLREAARRANVSHGAPAHHFQNKAGLLTAFAAQGYERLGAAVEDTIRANRPADGAAMLEAIGQGYVRFAIEHPEQFEIMFRVDMLDPNDAAFAEWSNRAFALLSETVARCIEERRLDPATAEPLAVAAWSLVHGLAKLWISGRLGKRTRTRDPRVLAEQVTRLFVDGIVRGGR